MNEDPTQNNLWSFPKLLAAVIVAIPIMLWDSIRGKNPVQGQWKLSAFDQANLPYHWDAKKNRWIVDRDFTMTRVVDGKEQRLTIKKGFESDGYTGVWQCSDVLPAIVHDFIYERCKTLDDGAPITFADANNWLYELMRRSNDWWTQKLAWTYWLGVTMFGRCFWRDRQTFKARLVFKCKSRFNGLPPLKMA
jgi:hypothetical protein